MGIFKVLLAEDEDSVLEIMARKISGAGYQVVTAKDGQEAWDKINAENPDVIVLDITMPKMDGLQVLGMVRQKNAGKWQPVIIVSALNETHHIQRGLELQADHYLTKPCRMEEILKSIRMMLSLVAIRNV